MTPTPDTKVLFNASCPVCNFEISHYAAYSARNGLPIRFDDLNSDALAQWDLTEDQAARRLKAPITTSTKRMPPITASSPPIPMNTGLIR